MNYLLYLISDNTSFKHFKDTTCDPNLNLPNYHQFKVDSLVDTYKWVINLHPLLYSTSSHTLYCAAVHWNLHALVWSLRTNPPSTSCINICYAYRWDKHFFYNFKSKTTTKMTYLQSRMSFSPTQDLFDIHLGSDINIEVPPGSCMLPLLRLVPRATKNTVLSGLSVSHPDTEGTL